MRISCCLIFSFACLQFSVLANRHPPPRQTQYAVRDLVGRSPRQEDNAPIESVPDRTAPDSEKKSSTRKSEERLMKALFSNYNQDVFPGEPAEVGFGLNYNCANYDEKSHMLTSSAWLRLSWADERLTWNPSDYGGVDSIRLPVYRIWSPDIKLYNAIEPEQKEWTNALIFSTGQIYWLPPSTFKTFCSPTRDGTRAFCTLKYGSWTYDGFKMSLQSYENETLIVDQKGYFDGCPYYVENLAARINNVYYPCCTEPYPQIHIKFDVVKNK